MSPPERGKNDADRAAARARRAALVASALGCLLTPQRASAQEARPASPAATPPPPPPSRAHTGGGLSTEFWLPIVPSHLPTPPSLIGGNARVFVDLPASGLELRLSAGASVLASPRGLLVPVQVQFEPVFSPAAGMVSTIGIAAGAQVPVGYEARVGEPALVASPLVSFLCSPFGFRFGPQKGGELGVRFGANLAKRDENGERVWAFSSVSAGAWIAYHFSEPPDPPALASAR